jgi:ribosome biogenesis GTPase
MAGEDTLRQAWVHERVPPSSHIARRDGDGRRPPVVSTSDVALLVMGLDEDFNPRRLERYLALVHGDAIVPVVVLTKRDVAASTPEALDLRLDALRGRIPSHVDVVAVNATTRQRACALQGYLGRDRRWCLLGSSGAGKSTLTNTLLGSAVQDTGAVRASDSRGMIRRPRGHCIGCPGGGASSTRQACARCVQDTTPATLAGSYADIEALAGQCRFRDCRHAGEPGCAVRDGVDADRLRNYHKLLREVAPRHTHAARPAETGLRYGKRGDAPRMRG